MTNSGAKPNAQNSELDPKKHPSGARIEKMMSEDKGQYGETLRPSEREDSPSDMAAHDADTDTDTHRRTPSTRQQ